MRHRRKGRKLGRSPSHQRALLRGLAINLFLSERDKEHPIFHDPVTKLKPPAVQGRIVTTLAKAKEARPLVEKCITIAKGALSARDRADELASSADRNTDAWRAWRASREWREWNTAVAPVVAAQPSAVVIWAAAPVVAGVLKSLRELGSTLPVYTGPTGEDPSVRTTLEIHPDWVQGLTFASLRITDAAGLARWAQFRLAYETRYGEDRLALGETLRRPVVQPPDWQMLSYDIVYLVKAALEKAGTTDPGRGKLAAALNEVQAQGANGTAVGWTASNHEGMPGNQVYLAVILNLNFRPVQDDPISKAEPQIEQD